MDCQKLVSILRTNIIEAQRFSRELKEAAKPTPVCDTINHF
jgi:hypothetical protein